MDRPRRRRRPGDFPLTGGRGRRKSCGPAGPEGEDSIRFKVFCECLRFGASLDRSKVNGLEDLYGRYASESDADDRTGLLLQVSSAVEEGIGSVTSLLPFLLFDGEPGVIRTATIETALLMPLQDGDSMTGPRHLLETAREAPDDHTKSGILGGLLLLGDRRVTDLMECAWRSLAPNARPALIGAWSGYVFAPMIEFLVAWLREADEPDASGIITTLTSMPEMAVHPKVLDIERTFPITEACADDDGFRVIREWTFEEYRTDLSIHLIDMTLSPDHHKGLEDLLIAWGIEG
ncbi:MAG: hypothetical protein ABIK65_07555 [Candidatus Eisenbacteria bacterium]